MSASGAGPIGMFANGGQAMLEWFQTRLITVFGQGSPAEQTAVSLLLAVVSWSTTFITLGVSVILAFLFTFPSPVWYIPR